MVDQDGVVCDRNYQTTCDVSSLRRFLHDPQIEIIPNSDTPVSRLANNFKTMLGIAPDIIIGELGSVVSIYGKLIVDLGLRAEISSFRQSLVHLFSNYNATALIDDSATWVKDRKAFQPNKRLVLIDGERVQSFAFYLLVSDGLGQITINNDWMAEGLELASQLELPTGLNIVDKNPNYGIVIGHKNSACKRAGYLILREHLGNTSYFMVGDSSADILGSNHEVCHCAVANASKELKQHAQFVSQMAVTEGLKDALTWIQSL